MPIYNICTLNSCTVWFVKPDVDRNTEKDSPPTGILYPKKDNLHFFWEMIQLLMCFIAFSVNCDSLIIATFWICNANVILFLDFSRIPLKQY